MTDTNTRPGLPSEKPVVCEALPVRRVVRTYYGDKPVNEKMDLGVVVTCGKCKHTAEQMGEELFKHLANGGTANGQCEKCGVAQRVVAAAERRVVLATNAQASAEIQAARVANSMRGAKR